ncbi:SGNH/GDSL hydrolase family protein [Rhodococcus pyridinivorans]
MRVLATRVFAVLATACAAVLIQLPTAVAAPDDGASLVVMGDSFTATTPLIENSGNGCPHPPTSWPAQLAESLGVLGSPDFVDVSCNGGAIDTGPGWTLSHQAKQAVSAGGFGAGTRAVLIQLGLNDTWGTSGGRAFPSVDCLLDVVRGCGLDAVAQGRVPDAQGVDGTTYANRVRAVVDYIRYYAPNARIVLVGYPEIFQAGQTSACLRIGGADVVQPRAEGYIAYLDRLDSAQRDAAGILGVDFFDTRALTSGRGSCAPESWISGITEPNSFTVGAPIHPTPHGNKVIADALNRRLSW